MRHLLVAIFFISTGFAPSGTSTLVPDLTRMEPTAAYALLHELKLRVAIPTGFAVAWDCFGGGVRHQRPAPGERVPLGAVVSLQLDDQCPQGQPPAGTSAATVPRLVGRRLSGAADILSREKILWTAEVIPALPPLRYGTRRLFGNYRVTKQSVPPGTPVPIPGRGSGLHYVVLTVAVVRDPS